jgi:hypothetical protein
MPFNLSSIAPNTVSRTITGIMHTLAPFRANIFWLRVFSALEQSPRPAVRLGEPLGVSNVKSGAYNERQDTY